MAAVKEKEILRRLKKFSDDVDWISKKQATLRKKFAGKYIAVAGCQVIDSDPELDTLLRRLKEKGEDPAQIPIEFISREPPRLIL
jgi:hypothetical protein